MWCLKTVWAQTCCLPAHCVGDEIQVPVTVCDLILLRYSDCVCVTNVEVLVVLWKTQKHFLCLCVWVCVCISVCVVLDLCPCLTWTTGPLFSGQPTHTSVIIVGSSVVRCLLDLLPPISVCIGDPIFMDLCLFLIIIITCNKLSLYDYCTFIIKQLWCFVFIKWIPSSI